MPLSSNLNNPDGSVTELQGYMNGDFQSAKVRYDMPTKPQLYLPPSGASCWTVCTAQPAYVRDNQDKIPADLSTIYSLEGEEAHALCECILKEEEVPPFADAEMLKHARKFADYCRSLLDPFYGGEMQVEQRVPLFYMPERNGRIDCSVLNVQARELHVVDMKYGAGIKVEAEGNKQMASYGKSVLKQVKRFGITPLSHDLMVHMHIFQPRNGGVSTWSINAWDLAVWANDNIGAAAGVILSGGETRFAPSDETCRFCPAKSFCSARETQLLSGFPDLDDAVRRGNVEVLPPLIKGDFLTERELVYVKTHGGAIKKWIDEVCEYLDARANEGKMPAGFKQVNGRGQRFWKDEKRAEELLRQKLTADQVKPAKLISPAQAEELLEDIERSTRFDNLFESLIGKRHGAPILVPESDPREPFGTSVAAAFRDLPQVDADEFSL